MPDLPRVYRGEHLAVGTRVEVWITGQPATHQAEVIQSTPGKYSDLRLRVIGGESWPILKDGDFIIRRVLVEPGGASGDQAP